VVGGDDAMHHGKAKPRALPCLLGGKERLEKAPENGLRDAWPRVFHIYHDVIGGGIDRPCHHLPGTVRHLPDFHEILRRGLDGAFMGRQQFRARGNTFHANIDDAVNARESIIGVDTEVHQNLGHLACIGHRGDL